MTNHDHPLTEGKVIKEEVVNLPYAGEGCEEHYTERNLKFDANYRPSRMQSSEGKKQLIRTMIIGEVIATPRCKKPYKIK